MRLPTWTVARAKAKFDELIERARVSGPQIIARNRRNVVVVVSVEEWERKTMRKGNLVDFLASSPLRGSDLVIERSEHGPREVKL